MLLGLPQTGTAEECVLILPAFRSFRQATETVHETTVRRREKRLRGFRKADFGLRFERRPSASGRSGIAPIVQPMDRL